MPADIAQWGFLVLILLVAGPILFYLISLFVMWVRWVTVKKKEVNESYAEILALQFGKSQADFEVSYKLGINSEVEITILDNQFNAVLEVFNGNNNKGTHTTLFNVGSLGKGIFYCQLITDNQKITKRFDL